GAAGLALEAGAGVVGGWGWWLAAAIRFGVVPFHGVWTTAWGDGRSAGAWLPLQAATIIRAAIVAPEFPAALGPPWIWLLALVAAPMPLVMGEARWAHRVAKLLAATMPALLALAAERHAGASLIATGAALVGAAFVGGGRDEPWARLAASLWWCAFFGGLLATVREAGAPAWGAAAAVGLAAVFGALLRGAPGLAADETPEADWRRRMAAAITLAGLALAAWQLRAGG
ncbi:MAG TPA: hypothetical protein VNC50_06370, partial [Planctomycetia bacterium]|nr:hypothetical protein [Planctomycetia bacterium]